MPDEARETARKELEQLDRFGDSLAVTVERRKKRDDAARIAGVPTVRAFVTGDYTDWLTVNRKTGDALARLILSAFPAELLDKPMDAISVHALERWKIGAAAKGNTAATLARKLTALQGAYSKAVKWGVVTDNPIKHVERDGKSNQIERFLTDDEERRLMAALVAREEGIRDARDRANAHRRMRKYKPYPPLHNVPFAGDYLRPAVIVSLHCGLRRGELLALRWHDIQFETRTLIVRRANAKDDDIRRVPLNDTALATLKQWRKVAHDVFVFAGESGEPITEIKTAWANVLRAAGIVALRWHDLRHSFASRLIQRGADLYVVKELCGHATIQMTERYAHLGESHVSAAVALLDTPKKRALRSIEGAA
ncbi:integrase [Paraburkholderia atlantica]|uniref:tyrosine-type recombinase/integrase n=1 Tax=Paraburkholderia atlantica TaxID=2654982 RepID=UPI003D1CCAE7